MFIIRAQRIKAWIEREYGTGAQPESVIRSVNVERDPIAVLWFGYTVGGTFKTGTLDNYHAFTFESKRKFKERVEQELEEYRPIPPSSTEGTS